MKYDNLEPLILSYLSYERLFKERHLDIYDKLHERYNGHRVCDMANPGTNCSGDCSVDAN